MFLLLFNSYYSLILVSPSNWGYSPLTVNMLQGNEVAKHDNQDDCWVIIHGKAYDVTDFLPEHPGRHLASETESSPD